MPATDIQTALAQQRRSRAQQSWWGILKQTASEWMDDDAMTWAAAVACYTLLALAPLLVIGIKVVTVFMGARAASRTVSTGAVSWMGPAASQAIQEIIERTSKQGGGRVATIVSLVLVVFGVGGVFAELQQAMNRIWKLKRKPGSAIWSFLRARLKSVVVMAIAALLLLASVVVATWLGNITKSLGMGWKFMSWVIDVVVSVGVLTLLFALIYRTVPDAEIEWRTTWIGALISAILFEIGKYGLALYFKYAAPTSAFGAVGSLAAVLIWIYYSAQIMFFGAEFTQVYAKVRRHGVRPSRYAEVLSKCDETETPTPSSQEPQQKPARPAKPRPALTSRDPYAQVLGQYAGSGRASAAPSGMQQRPLSREYLFAGAGLALGALIGGYGALTARTTAAPRAKQAAVARFNARLRRVQQTVDHASRVRDLLDADDMDERIDALEQRIFKAGRKPRPWSRRLHPQRKWTERVVSAVKSYF